MSRVVASQNLDMSEAFSLSDRWDDGTVPEGHSPLYFRYMTREVVCIEPDGTPTGVKVQADETNSTVEVWVDDVPLLLTNNPQENFLVSDAVSLEPGTHEVKASIEVNLSSGDVVAVESFALVEVT